MLFNLNSNFKLIMRFFSGRKKSKKLNNANFKKIVSWHSLSEAEIM